MKSSAFLESLDWIWIHWPDVALISVILFGGISITLAINNFMHRFKNTEHLCNDMHQRQLPEIRSEIRELRTDLSEARTEMNEIRTEMNARFTKVELSLNTIVTYLQAKGNKISL